MDVPAEDRTGAGIPRVAGHRFLEVADEVHRIFDP